jgi:hypothetical protein
MRANTSRRKATLAVTAYGQGDVSAACCQQRLRRAMYCWLGVRGGSGRISPATADTASSSNASTSSRNHDPVTTQSASVKATIGASLAWIPRFLAWERPRTGSWTHFTGYRRTMSAVRSVEALSTTTTSRRASG